MLRIQVDVFLLTLIASNFLAFANGDDPCRYEVPGKGFIDITPLAHTDGTAAYPQESPSVGSNFVYSYNPCKPFSDGDPCVNVAVCQESVDQTLKFVLGKHDSATWSLPTNDNDTTAIISYIFQEKNVKVMLQCLETSAGYLEAVGEGPTNFYQFRLHSKYSCWNSGKGSTPGRLSGGAIFVIFIVAVCLIYLIGFAIFNAVYHHHRGIDLIAHRKFWVAVGSYSKDGVLFTVNRLRGRSGTYQSV